MSEIIKLSKHDLYCFIDEEQTTISHMKYYDLYVAI